MNATPSLIIMWIFFIFLSGFPIIYTSLKKNK